MIPALTLLLAASSPAPRTPQTPATSPFEAALTEGNRAWYLLPRATTTFVATLPSGESVTMREVRDGGKFHFDVRRGEETIASSFADGKTNVVLDHANKQYSVDAFAPVDRQKAWTALEPLPALVAEGAEVRFLLERGLVLRTDPALPIVSDGTVDLDGAKVRKLVASLTKPYRDDEHPGGTFEANVFFDLAGGWIRRAEATFRGADAATDPLRFTLECKAEVPAEETFTVDVTTLSGWTKSETPIQIGSKF